VKDARRPGWIEDKDNQTRVENIFIAKTLLGHSGISSTMQYCAPDQKLAAYKAKEILSQVLQ
jgi:hypothetical protein